MKILVINGVNLNMLGNREKEIYGSLNYIELKTLLLKEGVDEFQSNFEGEIVEKIHEIVIKKSYEGLIINPGAYSHYSIAIYDALLMLKIPKIEVHISDVYNREEFRKKLVTSKACDAVISGKNIDGYFLAIDQLKRLNPS